MSRWYSCHVSNRTDEDLVTLRRIVKLHGVRNEIGFVINEFGMGMCMRDGDQRMEAFARDTRAAGLETRVSPYSMFERHEIEASKYCCLHDLVFLPDSYLDDTGPMRGTKYDMTSACGECGAGARQVGPMVVSPRVLPRKRLQARSDFGLLLYESVMAPLNREPRIAPAIVQAVARKTRQPVPWYQFIGTHTLPKLQGTGITNHDNRCKSCDRGWWGIESCWTEFYLNSIDHESLPPVCETWECWGAGVNKLDHRQYPMPMTVVHRDIALHLYDSLNASAVIKFIIPIDFR